MADSENKRRARIASSIEDPDQAIAALARPSSPHPPGKHAHPVIQNAHFPSHTSSTARHLRPVWCLLEANGPINTVSAWDRNHDYPEPERTEPSSWSRSSS